MNQLTICNTVIRQDSSGRYNLNDLHKAAGNESKDQPSKFFDRIDTQLLRAELALTPGIPGISPVFSLAGRYGGTFVVKELVYAYAMWISPRFHLQVIRAYDALVTQPVVVPAHALAPVFKAPGTLREALLLALAQEEQIEALGAANLKLEHQVAT